MGDDPQQNTPSPDSGDAGEVVSQQDLDALLAEASELAAEIASDVGVDELDPADVESMHLTPATSQDGVNGEIAPSEDASPETDVDKSLADLDDILLQAQDELGTPEAQASDSEEAPDGARQPLDEANADAATPRPGPTGDNGLADPDTIPLPDVVSRQKEDLMEPPAQGADAERVEQEDDLLDLVTKASDAASSPAEEPAVSSASTDDPTATSPAADSDAQHAPAASDPSVPDFMQEFMETEEESSDRPPVSGGVADLPELSEPSSAGPTEATPSSVPAAPGRDPAPASGPLGTKKAAVRKEATQGVVWRAVARVSPLAMRVVERGIDFLEIANRPVRWLGDGAREALGWLAIATLGTALLVYLVSLV